MRLLLIEDDVLLAEGVNTALTRAGYTVDWVSTAADALADLQAAQYSLIILDLGLPDMDGLSLLSKIRQQLKQELPVLILTARDQLDDKVSGLDAGADDYLAKPFELDELLARLRALLRRRPIATATTLTCGDIELDPEAWTASYKNEDMGLSRREMMVLRLLMEQQGKVVTKSALANQLYNWDDEIGSNTLEVYVHGLRKRMGKAQIKTIRGVGYMLLKNE